MHPPSSNHSIYRFSTYRRQVEDPQWGYIKHNPDILALSFDTINSTILSCCYSIGYVQMKPIKLYIKRLVPRAGSSAEGEERQ